MSRSASLERVEFAENPEPRCPCLLLLDTSSSMRGKPIAALNRGLVRFKEELSSNSLAARRVEIAVVSFDSEIRLVHGFATVDDFKPPVLEVEGLTCMGAAINLALDLVATRKERYKAAGISYYRPWIFMITDGEPEGEPHDVVRKAAERIREEELGRRVAFFGVGVASANMRRLTRIVPRRPLRLSGLRFDELFAWLSTSMQAVSLSRVDEQVALPPLSWAEV
jgi:uncharacterized protein YegL